MLLGAIMLANHSGCTRTVVTSPGPIEIGAAEYSRVYRAAVFELRDRGFRVDREDYRFGRVKTRPISAPTVLEVWDQTNSTGYQAMESTINNQRRLVSVQFDPATGPDGMPVESDSYWMGVEVMIERLQVPTRQLTGSTNGPSVFGSLASVPKDLQQRGIPGAYWHPIARDPQLERELLDEILRRAMSLADPAEGDDDIGPGLNVPPPTEGMEELP